MAGVEAPDIKMREPFERTGKIRPAPIGEVVPAEITVSKDRVATEEHPVLLREQANTARRMARRVYDHEIPDHIALGKGDVGNDPRGTGAKMHREAVDVIDKPPGFGLMDGDLRLTHVRDLIYPCDVVKMAMSKDDRIYLLFVGCYCHRHDPRIHEDISHNVGVCPWVPAIQPLDLHAQ